MLKNMMKYLGVIVLILFSFYYTDRAVAVIKRNDPVMKEILANQSNFREMSVNAIISGDTIIPGMNGLEVDIDESYKRMKQVNRYYESMLMFSEVIPDDSVLEQYDKFIISGNKMRSDIALLVKVTNVTNLEKIYKIFLDRNTRATFFIDGYVIENNMDLAYEMAADGFQIENFGYNEVYNEDDFRWTNNMIFSITNLEPRFCYSEYHDYEILNLCSKNKMYTVNPTLSVANNPFYTIKNNLKEGSIISLNLTEETLRELPAVISFINQKGYNLVTLSEIISEERSMEK